MELTINQLADQAGITIGAVRTYERHGLLFPESRNQSNYRIYDETSIERIKFIKGAQKLGFTLAEVRQLLNIKNDDKSSNP